MEIHEFQHPDSVWTWKTQGKGKVSLWLPYFERVEPSGLRKKDHYRFRYKGGEINLPLSKVDFIMLYGASGHLPVEFLDRLASYKIPLMIHRRNMPSPYLFFPDIGSDNLDVLSAQILSRSNRIKSCYLAKNLIYARLKSLEYMITIPAHIYSSLRQCRSIETIRNIEAKQTARYWRTYFKQLSLDDDMIRRDRDHPVNKALNAASFFISGIILRWVLFHKLSPEHGYVHQQTSYPSLVYDLIEPYRYVFERALLKVMPRGGIAESDKLTARVLQQIKQDLEEIIYVPQTRQLVRRKNLYHGVVLALRAYLTGDMKRLVIPTEGKRKGGRPIKISYRIMGEVK